MLTGSDSTSQNPFQFRLSSMVAGVEEVKEYVLGTADTSDTLDDLVRRLLLACSAISIRKLLGARWDVEDLHRCGEIPWLHYGRFQILL